jgi:transcriptional regulator with GAF, ATPase, and Fis domain
MRGTDMRLEPWLHFWQSKDPAAEQPIVQALSKAGLPTQKLNVGAPSGDGILFFEVVSADLFDFIQDVSGNGIHRVLAVPAVGAALDSAQAWSLLQAGASDVFHWTRDASAGEVIKARFERWRSVDRIVRSPDVQRRLVGSSPAWLSTIRQIVEIARFTAGSVLLLGESGTGKELIARLIHDLDKREPKKAFIILDCTTVVPELSGSEFFGHERGAFTGAASARDGAFALADGGTLFLDEVGELPLGLQAQLLRVAQEGTYKRVGSNAWQRTDFRLICATNKDILHQVESGGFRRDLYHRIAAWTCRVPPLGDRREDIIPLSRHFLREFRPDLKAAEVGQPVQEYLMNRNYPGNVRDLRQLMFRISSRHVGSGGITLGDVPEDERPSGRAIRVNWCDAGFDRAIQQAIGLGVGLKEISQRAAEAAIRMAVHRENGNLRLAAKRLGVTDRALQLRRATRRQHLGGAVRTQNAPAPRDPYRPD